MLSLHAFPADRASAQPTLQFRVTRQHSSLSGAAHSCSAMDIYVVFTQLSSQAMRSRALSAFATLLSTVCVTSGVPVITGRSCSSILCQVMRTEVSFPLHSQVTASLHHPRTGAFTSSTRTLLSPKATGHSQGWGELKQEDRQLGWILDTKRVLSRWGDIQVTGKRMGHKTSMAEVKMVRNTETASVKSEGTDCTEHSLTCGRSGWQFPL